MLTEEKSRKIFAIRSQIQSNKSLGYNVQPLTYLGKMAVRVTCKPLKVNFLIDPVSLAELRGKWHADKVGGYIEFMDWILKDEVI